MYGLSFCLLAYVLSIRSENETLKMLFRFVRNGNCVHFLGTYIWCDKASKPITGRCSCQTDTYSMDGNMWTKLVSVRISKMSIQLGLSMSSRLDLYKNPVYWNTNTDATITKQNKKNVDRLYHFEALSRALFFFVFGFWGCASHNHKYAHTKNKRMFFTWNRNGIEWKSVVIFLFIRW